MTALPAPSPSAPAGGHVAVIVAAGRGTRLLPLTAARPKCLVPVGGRAILDHQLDALAAAGVTRAVVVAGYHADQVASHVAAARPAVATEVLLNPFWSVASSIGSVWAARAHLERPFLLLNGDTVFDGAVLREVLAGAGAAGGVALAVEPVARFEPDDMRVAVRDGRVGAVAKTLDAAGAGHRSLGLVVGGDDDAYLAALHRVIGAPDGEQAFHHDIVDLLARDGRVAAVAATGGRWCEIDRPEDIAAWLAADAAVGDPARVAACP